MFDINEASLLAGDILELAKDEIIVRFRYFDAAISVITPKVEYSSKCVRLDEGILWYNPVFLLQQYKADNSYAKKLYLHILMHLIFSHCFRYEKTERELWDLSADIAAENIVFEISDGSSLPANNIEALEELEKISRSVSSMTADGIYKEFVKNKPDKEKMEKYKRLFSRDSHECWAKEKKSSNVKLEEDWKNISRKVRIEMISFTKSDVISENIENNFDMALRDRYDYRDLLKKFVSYKEETALSEDEFDYVYYTYGLNTYGNVPLVEPLEYKEVKKIDELAIVLDTSASCKGELIKKFINITYDIIRDTDSIFSKTNIHIIQCDTKVQSDYIVRSKDDIENFINNEKISGYGGTDFRHAFEYIDNLIKKGELINLKGVIYFTDGYGIYPSKMPKYDVIFAFMDYDKNRQSVPGWAIEVVVKEALQL